MSNNRVKGLLKGLRYISQIFDNEKEAEMQIGFPTDVKHVAHIGWDSPSVNSPSWMTEFKTPPSFSSAPLSLSAPGDIKEDVSVKWVSEDSNRRGVRGGNLPELPKSSKRQSSSGTAVDSQSPTTTREKSDKPKARRSSKSKDSPDQKQSIRRPADENQGNESQSSTLSLPDIPRNARRKKSSVGGGSTRSKTQVAVAETYKSPFSDPGSGTGSISISKDSGLCQTP